MKEAAIHPEEKAEETSVHYTPVHESNTRPRRPVGLIVLCIILAVAAAVLGLRVHQLSATIADTRAQLAQSHSETARAQTRIDSASAASARLQSQLDQAGSQRSSLQARLDKSNAQATGLQSQLDKDKAQAAALQSQLDASKTQLTDSQAKLDQANAGSSELKKELDQAKSQSADLQSRLQKAESDAAKPQPVAQEAQKMPITTSFEKAFFGHSRTLHVKNLNSGPLTVNITINGAARTPSHADTIKSGETLDVAKLAVGQNVVIASEGYEPMKLTVQ